MGSALKWLLVFCAFLLAWILLTLILTAQLTYGGGSWTVNLSVSIMQMLPWVVTSPVIIFASYRFPLLHDRWLLNTVLHVFLCFIILVTASRISQLVVDHWPVIVQKGGRISENVPITQPREIVNSAKVPMNGATGYKPSSLVELLLQRISDTALLGVPLYLIILFLFSLVRHRSEMTQRDKDSLRLESQLTQTQLDLLRSQLQPHFLFNTLNSISTLIYSDPDNADKMVIQLSKLLRRTLDQRDEKFIPLDQEIATLNTYLEIQAMRFGGRMVVKLTLEEQTLKCLVPPMILLPLVENAVRYGVEKSIEPTTIRIDSKIHDGRLHLSIIDNGPGISDSNESGTGVGLANTQSRLEVLYPADDCSVILQETEADGVVASIEFPIQTEST